MYRVYKGDINFNLSDTTIAICIPLRFISPVFFFLFTSYCIVFSNNTLLRVPFSCFSLFFLNSTSYILFRFSFVTYIGTREKCYFYLFEFRSIFRFRLNLFILHKIAEQKISRHIVEFSCKIDERIPHLSRISVRIMDKARRGEQNELLI